MGGGGGASALKNECVCSFLRVAGGGGGRESHGSS